MNPNATTSLLASQSVDWQASWWQPWRGVIDAVLALLRSGHGVHEALNRLAQQGAGDRVRFVPQTQLPQGMAYESYIFDTQTVPTRDNWHDLFNGLAWLRFPRTKARLNALQAAQISLAGVQSLRGAVRDALTLFDENAVLLSQSLHAPVIEALKKRDWQAAFQTHRDILALHPPVIFGHALLEKLLSPYKAVTGHVFPVTTPWVFTGAQDCAQLDADLAAQLCEASLCPKPFVPLPVLGVPGWWAANEGLDFYMDSTVFRAPRS